MRAKDITPKIKLVSVEQCPLCFSTKKVKYNIKDDKVFNIDAFSCLSCGLIYMNKFVSEDSLEILYNSYNSNRDFENSDLKEKRKIMYSLDYDYLKKYIYIEGEMNVLDFGCGEGDFLNYFVNCNKHGVEIDNNAIKRGHCKYSDISFYKEYIELGESYNSYFDLIIFRGTIQYVSDLASISKFCNDKVKQGGYIVFLATPNSESILANLQKEDWSLYNSIEHRYCFSKKQLEMLLGEKFSVVNYELPYLGTPYENYEIDFKRLIEMIVQNNFSKYRMPFWGSMMNVLFTKIE